MTSTVIFDIILLVSLIIVALLFLGTIVYIIIVLFCERYLKKNSKKAFEQQKGASYYYALPQIKINDADRWLQTETIDMYVIYEHKNSRYIIIDDETKNVTLTKDISKATKSMDFFYIIKLKQIIKKSFKTLILSIAVVVAQGYHVDLRWATKKYDGTKDSNIEKGLYYIWCEGYAATGEKSGARLLNHQPIKATSFNEAVKIWQELSPSKTLHYYPDEDRWMDWGCCILDNEKAARKRFG